MYVTRPLSLYRRDLDALSLSPSEGPNSGYLVLQDEESTQTCCFGICKVTAISDLPFPQNKLITVRNGSNESSTDDPVYLIPVINQPLSSNVYYAIKPNGKHAGEAFACSRDEDMVTCCFCKCVKDVKPRPFNPEDIYQQLKFSTSQNCGTLIFSTTSVASDGHPPYFLQGRTWSMYSQTPKHFSLGEAPGLDPRLRSRLPDFNFPLSFKESQPVVVGKWYCPFMFIKDIITPKDQVKKSLFYEMTLEQLWDQIFFYEKTYTTSSQGNDPRMVDVTVRTESQTVAGTDAIQEDHQENQVNKMVWFKSIDGTRDQPRVGLSSLILQRMTWEEERVGWIPKKEKQEKVSRTEESRGIGMWRIYGCYMLVERFVLKRMDGTVVFTYSFNHTNQIRSKWE